MSSKIQGVLGFVFMLVAAACAAASVVFLWPEELSFSADMPLGQLIGLIIPLAFALGLVFAVPSPLAFLAKKRRLAWILATAAFICVGPGGFFIGFFGILDAGLVASVYGVELGADPPLVRVLKTLFVEGGAVAAFGAALFNGLGAFLLRNSIVKDSEDTFDRNPTRGMNLMDPNVQKEMEKAKKRYEKEN